MRLFPSLGCFPFGLAPLFSGVVWGLSGWLLFPPFFCARPPPWAGRHSVHFHLCAAATSPVHSRTQGWSWGLQTRKVKVPIKQAHIRSLDQSRPKCLPVGETGAAKLGWSAMATINVVVELVSVQGPGLHIGRIGTQLVRVEGIMEETSKDLVLIQWVQVEDGAWTVLRREESSTVHEVKPRTIQQLLQLVDCCAGIGAMCRGAAWSGWHTVAMNEWKQPFVDILHRNTPPPIVRGDVCDPQVQAELVNLAFGAGTLCAGVSCQPYSRLGNRQQELDERASTLPAVLNLGVLLQVDILVLECVPQIQSNHWAQELITRYANQRGHVVRQTELHLQKAWCSRRSRWWCVIAVPWLDPDAIPDLPLLQEWHMPISVMPHVKQWPHAEIIQLILTTYEERIFLDHGGSWDAYLVTAHKQLATALHSWGNQVYPCACTCRSAGFTDERLSAQGLHAVLVPYGVKPDGITEVVRHPHPAEAALWCGLDPSMDFGPNMRVALAGVGQLASPIQSVWIFTHIAKRVAGISGISPPVPSEALNQYLQELIQKARSIWCPTAVPTVQPRRPSAAPNLPSVASRHEEPSDPIAVLVRSSAHAKSIVVSVPPGTTCAELCEAESRVSQVEGLRLLDVHGDLVPMDEVIAPGQSFVHCVPDVSQPEIEPDAGQLSVPRPTAEYREHMRSCTAASVTGSITEMQWRADQRNEMLLLQGAWFAEDELMFHLKAIASTAADHSVGIIPPVFASQMLEAPSMDLLRRWWLAFPSRDEPQAVVVTVVRHQQHWIPVLYVKHGHSLQVDCRDTVPEVLPLRQLHTTFAQAVQAVSTDVRHKLWTHLEEGSCGAAAIRFVHHCLSAKVDEGSAYSLHSQRSRFVQHVAVSGVVPVPCLLAAGREIDKVALMDQLSPILREHGVFPARVDERAKFVVQQLGAKPVHSALQATQPWARLKQLSNDAKPRVQLVLPDELQQQIAQRAKIGKPVGKKSAAGSKQSKPPQPPVLPDHVQVHHRCFQNASSEFIGQLTVDQIGQAAEGFVLVDCAAAQPYLDADAVVSSKALALLVLGECDQPAAPSLPSRRSSSLLSVGPRVSRSC